MTNAELISLIKRYDMSLVRNDQDNIIGALLIADIRNEELEDLARDDDLGAVRVTATDTKVPPEYVYTVVTKDLYGRWPSEFTDDWLQAC